VIAVFFPRRTHCFHLQAQRGEADFEIYCSAERARAMARDLPDQSYSTIFRHCGFPAIIGKGSRAHAWVLVLSLQHSIHFWCYERNEQWSICICDFEGWFYPHDPFDGDNICRGQNPLQLHCAGDLSVRDDCRLVWRRPEINP